MIDGQSSHADVIIGPSCGMGHVCDRTSSSASPCCRAPTRRCRRRSRGPRTRPVGHTAPTRTVPTPYAQVVHSPPFFSPTLLLGQLCPFALPPRP